MNDVGVKIYVTGLSVNNLGELELLDKSFKEVKIGRIQTKVSEKIDKSKDDKMI